jgi:2-polyprenyl-3-methyl-5-hydroxy-6-metoxy-1,4-benzoquinol methylase
MAKLTILNPIGRYEDGGEAYVKNSLAQSKNTSWNSEELESKIIDWSSEYHFSSERVNLLSIINFKAGMRVLDVGGGTGILSRYMAEKGCQVTLLEGELIRAEAAQIRMKDLGEVEIIVGRIEDLVKSGEYDLILICGVLEYIGAENSKEWLLKLIEHLKPDGTIVLAIENRMGLKYWLGYPEDHTGKLWDGLVDYEQSDLPRTYTKKELSKIFKDVGMDTQTFFYPFPDYKKPRQIISDDGVNYLNSENIYSLISNPFGDHAGKSNFKMDKRAVFKTIIEAGLISEFSNSFILVANKSNQSNKIIDKNLLLVRCDGSARRNQFRRWKYLYKTDKSSDIQWQILRAGCNGNREFVDFIEGSNFLTRFQSEKYSKSKETLIATWVETIRKLEVSLEQDQSVNISLGYRGNGCISHDKISYLDIGFSNFVFGKEGIKLVDFEWKDKSGICLELAIYRALYYCPEILELIESTVSKNLSLWQKIEIFYEEYVSNSSKHSITDFISAEIFFLSQTHLIDAKLHKRYLIKMLKQRRKLVNVRLTARRLFRAVFRLRQLRVWANSKLKQHELRRNMKLNS